MSIKRTFNGASIIKPGAYSKIVVENLTGFPLQTNGTVAIVGEAAGGQPHVLDILSAQGIQEAKSRYKSGPIADALELLANPSNDERIPNGASKIIVYKTNPSTQSSLNLMNTQSSPVAQVLLKSKNYGSDENQISVSVAVGSIADASAKLDGSISGPFTLAGSETLILKSNSAVYTFTNTLSGSTTAAAMVAEINTAARWSASTKPVIASVISGTQKIRLDIDPAVVIGSELDYGYLMVDPACTIDTILGISGSNRGIKGSRYVTATKGLLSEVSQELGGLSQMSIKYVGAGTACTMDLNVVSNELRLKTTCTGATADNLDILIKDANGRVYHTMKSLSELIDQNSKYESVLSAINPFLNADALDFYSGLHIMDVAASLKKDVQDMVDGINSLSTLLVASKIENVYRAVKSVSPAQFLSGAIDGVSANSDFANAMEAFKEEKISVVVPLISQDQGALTIDSINALASSHAAWGWSTEGRSERSAFVSKLCSKSDLKSAAQALNSGYVSIFGQDQQVLDKNSNLVWMEPWASACIAAGMRCGAEVGEPLTGKVIRTNGIRVRDGSWSPKKDYAEMIDAGVTIIETLDNGSNRIVVGNTTYGKDPSFVWNRESVVQAAGFVAYDLRFNLDLAFTGSKARTGTAEALANFIKARMSTYLEADIIVGDDLNDGLGFKSLSVSIQGNTAIINVSVTPVQGIDFILPTIYLADIRQSA